MLIPGTGRFVLFFCPAVMMLPPNIPVSFAAGNLQYDPRKRSSQEPFRYLNKFVKGEQSGVLQQTVEQCQTGK